MFGMFSHASGISIIIACSGSRPESVTASSTLSSTAESLPPSSWMIGFSRSTSSPQSEEWSSGSRARCQLRLPWSVLISPLWASIRKGCESTQFGNVFVL